MIWRAVWLLMWTVLIVGLVGCASATEQQLRDRAAFDFDCPESELELHEIDDRTMGVRGCGHRATYVEMCRYGEYGPYDCTWTLNTDAQDDRGRE